MRLYRNRKFWMLATTAFLLFAVMMFFRLGFHAGGLTGRGAATSGGTVSEQLPGETWMSIFQNEMKIGYTHRRLAPHGDGYLIDEKTVMNINTMGMTQEILVLSSSTTNRDFALETFEFSLGSGSFNFAVNGQIRENILYIHGDPTLFGDGKASPKPKEIPLENPIYLTGGILPATVASGLTPGNKMTLFLFDPATLAQAPATVTLVGTESLVVEGQTLSVRKINLSFKGATQSAWVDDKGQVLKEQGLLGITLVKTTRKEALDDIAPGGMVDVTALVSVASNVRFQEPEVLTTLQLRVTGVDTRQFSQKAEAVPWQRRQSWNGNVLTLQKESLESLPATISTHEMAAVDKRFILPEPFIQSDDVELMRIARRVVASAHTPLEKIKKLTAWIQDNIQREPVISLPNALSTLKNRRGDCNEHAALMAAFCRAVDIPAGIEAGLVYIKGRFYYHAWNVVFLGKWITVDALFGQIPCDVTHLSFTSGVQESQLNLMGIMGKIKLEVLSYNGHVLPDTTHIGS